MFISNFKSGTLDDWGLSYEEVSERNPRIVYAAGTSFGTEGTDAGREGADLSAQASGGLISTIGADGDPHSPIAVTICDHIACLNLVGGISAALFARERTGTGATDRRVAARRAGLGAGVRDHRDAAHRARRRADRIMDTR